MITAKGVTKKYNRFALNCSLEVLPGQVTGLIGQNGAGKSTMFKAALGLISIDGGSMQVFGKDVKDLTAKDRQKIGVVLADSGFSGYLKVKDIVSVMAHIYDAFDREYFLKACGHFGLPMDKKIREFSTGMKAKLKVLVAVSHRASLLILDEPTAGLDVVARDDILGILREYMEEDENRGILISSHISTDLEGICDNIYMIHEGSIILKEDTDVLLDSYGVLKVTKEQFARMDQEYLLKRRRESFGYSCLTNQRQFYLENYPELTVEKGNIDELIMMMIRGEDI